MIKAKTGNGGHGLEAYDEETGRYVKVAVSFEGKEANSWEDLRDAILETNPDWKQAYNSDPNIAQQFDEQVENQLYPEMFNAQVQYMNEHPELFDTSSEVEFSSPEDAAENLDKLFGPKLISTLINNGADTRESVKVNPLKTNYEVNIWAASLQMCRYGGNCRAKPISRAEFEEKSKKFPNTNIEIGRGTSNQKELIKFIESGDILPFNRTYSNHYTSQMWEDTKRSWYDENSDLNSHLCTNEGAHCKWYGDCIYASAGSYEYSGGGNTVFGCFDKKDCKILIGRHVSSYYSEYHTREDFFPELSRFVKHLRLNREAITEKLTQKLISGGVDAYTAKSMASRFIRNLLKTSDGSPYNQGLCAMVLGYDVMATDGFQFDILNPNKMEVIYD